MAFFDDVLRNIGNFFGANNKPKAQPQRPSAPRPTSSGSTLRSAVTSAPVTVSTIATGPDPEELRRREEEERRRREAEEARRKAQEEARRKAEVARLAQQTVRETNQELGADFQELGGAELRAMALEMRKGGDANLEVMKQMRDKIRARKLQARPAVNTAGVEGAPKAVNESLVRRGQELARLRDAYDKGQVTDAQVQDALNKYGNDEKTAQQTIRATQLTKTDPKKFIEQYNKMTDAEQRRVRDDLEQTATNYRRSFGNDELGAIGKNAETYLSLLQANPEELKKNGLPEVKHTQSLGGTIEDIAKTVGMAPASLLSRLGLQGKVLAGGKHPLEEIEDAYKRGELTQEEYIRSTGELNKLVSAATGSLNGEDKGLGDRFLRAAGTAAEAASYIVAPGTAFARGTVPGIIGKNLTLDTAIGAASAFGGQGVDTQWQDVLLGAGFGAAGSAAGLIEALPRMSNLTPDEFARLPRQSQLDLIKQAESVARRQNPTPEQIAAQPDPFTDQLAPAPREQDIAAQPVLSPDVVNGLARGGTAAANKILDNNGLKFPKDIQTRLSEALALAKTPDEVKLVLDQYNIPAETLKQRQARIDAEGQRVAAKQADELAEAPQDVAAPVETPAPETATPKLENSADIAQNNNVYDAPIKYAEPDNVEDWVRSLGETQRKFRAEDNASVKELHRYDAIDGSPNVESLQNYSAGRGTGGWGTGVYFNIKKQADREGGKSRHTTVKNSLEDPFIIRDAEQSAAVNDFGKLLMKAAQGADVDEFDLYMAASKAKLPYNKDIAQQVIEHSRKEINGRSVGVSDKSLANVDQPINHFMRAFGHDGILNRGVDDSTAGSVVFRGTKAYDNAMKELEASKAPKPEAPAKMKWKDTAAGRSYLEDMKDPAQREYQRKAGREAAVVEMTPDEYLERVYKSSEMDGGLDSYKQRLEGEIKGNGFDYSKEVEMPYVNMVNGGQDGAHRAMAAKLAGEDKMPVLLVDKPGTLPKSKEAPAPKTTTPEPTSDPGTKPSKTSQERTKAINPAIKLDANDNPRPLKDGKAGDGLNKLQSDLVKYGDQLPSKLTNNIRTVENLARNLEYKAPVFGKHFEKFRQEASHGMAEAIMMQDDVTTKFHTATKGMNKEQRQNIKYLAENFSNKKLLKKYEGTPEYEAARVWNEFAESVLPAMNAVLKAHNMKEIGTVKNYFARMTDLNSKQNFFTDLLDTTLDATVTRGEAKISKGFMKSRNGEETMKQIDPVDAMMIYARQSAQVLHLTPVVERGNAIAAVIEAAESVPPQARQQLAGLFRQVTNQVGGKDIHPKTGLAKAAAAVRNTVSKSQIAYSIHSIYAQIANPVAVSSSMITQQGLKKGGTNLFRLAANNIRNLGERDIKALETIDGMTSDYLVNARGAKSQRRRTVTNTGKDIVDAGYRFSNYGDIQSKHAAVKTMYDQYRRDGMGKKEALRKAERDARQAIGDRTMGERSKFTASNNPFNLIASQYQIEQIANVTNFMDETLFNPRISAYKKFLGVLAAAGTGATANAAVGFISNGQVKPLPDIIGASLEAYADVVDENERRKQEGEKEYTPEEMAGLFLTNTAANFISNLPFGRTAMSVTTGVVNAAGERMENENLADELGLNARDTNPAQTLPTIGAVTQMGDTALDVISGEKSLLEGAGTLASKVIAGGGQAKRTIEGVTTFLKGEDSYKPDEDEEKGDVKFRVNNNLATTEGWRNLFAMPLSGKFANKGGQEYLKDFTTQTERDVKNLETYDPNLTDEQKTEFIKMTDKRFVAQLSDADKKIFKTMQNKDLLALNVAEGKISEDKVDELKVKKNRFLYERGLRALIDTGFKKKDWDQLTPEQQEYMYERSIVGKKAFDKQPPSEQAKKVIAQAMADNPWPTIDTSKVVASNKLADKYLDYRKSMAEAGSDTQKQLEAREKFWGEVVRQRFDKDVPGAYSGPGNTLTNPRDSYGMSMEEIEAMLTEEGLKKGGVTVLANKEDLDAMIELDNILVKAGLKSKPKFGKEFRDKYGYAYPEDASEAGNTGYRNKAKGSGKGRGGRGSDKDENYANPLDYLKGGSGGDNNGFSIRRVNEENAPAMNLARYRNKGGQARTASIKIKL